MASRGSPTSAPSPCRIRLAASGAQAETTRHAHHVLDPDRHDLGTAERGREADQQQGAIPPAAGARVTGGDEPPECGDRHGTRLGDGAPVLAQHATQRLLDVAMRGAPLQGPERRLKVETDRRLALLSDQGAGAEFGTDQVLVSADRGFDVVASAVSGRSLPADAAFLGDELNVAVASGLQADIVGARYRGRTRRDDDVRRWIVLTACGGSVDRITVLGTVRRHARDHAFRLPEQSRRLRGMKTQDWT